MLPLRHEYGDGWHGVHGTIARNLFPFGGGKRGRPPGSSSRSTVDKTVVFILMLSMIALGTYMYFGTAAGGKIADFVDLKIHVENNVIPIGNPLLGHSITGATFNGAMVYGKVKANRDIPAGYWVAAQVIVAGYYKDVDQCGRTIWATGPWYYPNSGYYYLIKHLGDLKAGEVTDFSFDFSRDMLMEDITLQTWGMQYKSPPPDIGGFEGKVKLAIVYVPNPPQRTTTKYLIAKPDYVTVSVDEAFKWRFNLLYGSVLGQGFCNICTIDDGIVVNKQSVADVYGHGVVTIETKLSLSAAVLMFSIPFMYLLYASLVGRAKRGGKGNRNLRNIVIILIIILVILILVSRR